MPTDVVHIMRYGKKRNAESKMRNRKLQTNASCGMVGKMWNAGMGKMRTCEPTDPWIG